MENIGLLQIGTTDSLEGTSSSSKTTSPSPMMTTPIVEKIGKLEQLIIEGKGTLVDDNGKPVPVGIRKGNPFSKVGEVVVSESEDEMFEPNDPMHNYFSSAGGHNKLEGYLSDDYAAQVNDLPGQFEEFNNQFDFKLQGHSRK